MYSPKVTIHRVIVFIVYLKVAISILNPFTLNYSVKASISSKNAAVHIKESEISFGIPDTEASFSNPAELFWVPFSLHSKNVERFSVMMNFEYSNAELTVNAVTEKATKNG
jgi:hypothetical protein